ncbi:cupin domain-containing protein [Paraburkholderia sp. Ac-20342]|nr:cupin domain-containing protein [Paraburkholderia sp. Ac-20342]NIF51112.1 cupin domain-containing protein [Burkholderia sp. Ax-1724]
MTLGAPVVAQAHDAHANAPGNANGETIKQAYQYAIATVPGKSLTTLIVTYAPGGKSLPHRHGQSFVTAYVLSGAIRSQVEGGEARVYHAGESWTERPGEHHIVSENASNTEPATLIATLIADTNATDLLIFDK